MGLSDRADAKAIKTAPQFEELRRSIVNAKYSARRSGRTVAGDSKCVLHPIKYLRVAQINGGILTYSEGCLRRSR